MNRFPSVISAILLAASLAGPDACAVPGVSALTAPRPRQVVQRRADNRAEITIAGTSAGAIARIEARAVPGTGAGNAGAGTGWRLLAENPAPGAFTGTLRDVPAGGWYRIEVRALDAADAPVGAITSVDRVGVGEVFITAGQSNSVCFGAPPQVVEDDRVSTLALAANAWSPASDPQPDNSGFAGSGGSPWPRFGSRLVAAWNVPVGIVCTGYGGAGVAQFLPSANQFYPALRSAVQRFPAGGFRAVLWHQGETDALHQTAAALYASQLQTIIAQSRADAGWAVPWGVAQAAYISAAHYPGQEGVNAGQRAVCFNTANVFRGARTDDFHLEGKLSDTVHFNTAGLAEHGDRWADLVLGTAQPSVKNGDLEAGVALADGVAQIGQIAGFNAFNAAGDALTDASAGVFNPAPASYASASDGGPNGGVLPGMAGRQVAFLHGGSAGASLVQQLPATLRAGTRYEVRVALGVRTNGDLFGDFAIALMAGGTVLTETTGTRATLDALADGNAAGRFTDVSLRYDSPSTIASDQALDIRIRRVMGVASAYLDCDNVRLTATPRAFAAWQTDHFGSPANANAAAAADPDHDSLSNFLEFALDRAPNVPDPAALEFRADGSLFIQRRRATPGLAFQLETSPDLAVWTSAVGALEQTVPLGGGFEAATWLPVVPGALQKFFRLRPTLAESSADPGADLILAQ